MGIKIILNKNLNVILNWVFMYVKCQNYFRREGGSLWVRTSYLQLDFKLISQLISEKRRKCFDFYFNVIANKNYFIYTIKNKYTINYT